MQIVEIVESMKSEGKLAAKAASRERSLAIMTSKARRLEVRMQHQLTGYVEFCRVCTRSVHSNLHPRISGSMWKFLTETSCRMV